MNIDLRRCRHVLALDLHRNFARAAESLGLTQPALTRSLQALEKSIGARLFDRDRARVEPTPVGQRLIERARLLVNQAHAFGNGGSFDNGLNFTLSMGCGTWGGNSISENLNYRNFINITHLSTVIPEVKPSEDELFGPYFARHGRG